MQNEVKAFDTSLTRFRRSESDSHLAKNSPGDGQQSTKTRLELTRPQRSSHGFETVRRRGRALDDPRPSVLRGWKVGGYDAPGTT